jgi:hypothetical protein
MRPPRCILCESEHWTHDSHVTAGVKARAMVSAVLGETADKTPDKPRTLGLKPRTTPDTQAKPRTRPVSRAEVQAAKGCPACHGPLTRGTRGPTPRYCSDACRKRAARQ